LTLKTGSTFETQNGEHVNLEKIRTEYPFASKWFEINGNRMHYLDEGGRNSPVVLMVHGNPTWSFYYRNLVKALRDDYRIVVPDHIGCGLSDKPQDYPYRIEDHIKNLSALMEFLEIKEYYMVVHDWGGPIGFGYAIQSPQMVKGLVVMNTAVFYLDQVPMRIKICRYPFIGGLMVRGLNLFSIFAYYWAIKRKEKRTREVYAAYTEPYDSWKNRIAIHRFVQEIPLEKDHHTLGLFRELDIKINQFKDSPILIAWGDLDFVFTTNEFCAEFEKRFPGAESHHFPDAGHYVLEDAGEEIIPIVRDFIDRNS